MVHIEVYAATLKKSLPRVTEGGEVRERQEFRTESPN